MDRHVFRANRSMRGHGLASFFAKMFRTSLPLLKNGGRYLARQMLSTGLKTVNDIASGKNAKESMKRHLIDASDNMLDNVKLKIRRRMSGKGLKKPKRKKRTIAKKRKLKKVKRKVKKPINKRKKKIIKKNRKIKRKKVKKDIFDL